MALLKDEILTDTIEIRATPEKIFGFLTSLVDDESYRAWHPEDHVFLRWTRGEPWKEGSIVHAGEYIHGKLHKLKFIVTKVIPNAEIEYTPVSRFLRIYFPKNTFNIEQKDGTVVFTATVAFRVGWLVRTIARKRLERGVLGVRKHMKEEGENLKRILESGR